MVLPVTLVPKPAIKIKQDKQKLHENRRGYHLSCSQTCSKVTKTKIVDKYHIH